MIRFAGALAILISGTLLAANPRHYEIDVLSEIFGYGQADVSPPVDQLFQACPDRDCIPSIDQPKFLAPNKARFMRHDDLVLSVSLGGETRGYPLQILDHHEIVNDRFGDLHVAVTYCPLCGSGLAFVRELGGEPVEFGVSGLLYNSDLVMYDRRTNSLWQQITGEGIAGEFRGERLQALPVSIVSWPDWKESYPEGEVLAPVFKARKYRNDAYGDYASSNRLLFPVSRQDARLHSKKVVYGLEAFGRPIAIEESWLRKQGQWSMEESGRVLNLRVSEDGGIVAELDGEATPVHRMYWFAWYSFHTDTALIYRGNK